MDNPQMILFYIIFELLARWWSVTAKAVHDLEIFFKIILLLIFQQSDDRICRNKSTINQTSSCHSRHIKNLSVIYFSIILHSETVFSFKKVKNPILWLLPHKVSLRTMTFFHIYIFYNNTSLTICLIIVINNWLI